MKLKKIYILDSCFFHVKIILQNIFHKINSRIFYMFKHYITQFISFSKYTQNKVNLFEKTISQNNKKCK